MNHWICNLKARAGYTFLPTTPGLEKISRRFPEDCKDEISSLPGNRVVALAADWSYAAGAGLWTKLGRTCFRFHRFARSAICRIHPWQNRNRTTDLWIQDI